VGAVEGIDTNYVRNLEFLNEGHVNILDLHPSVLLINSQY
jgi:hypothetical protein